LEEDEISIERLYRHRKIDTREKLSIPSAMTKYLYKPKTAKADTNLKILQNSIGVFEASKDIQYGEELSLAYFRRL
jgi:hypothetical protein